MASRDWPEKMGQTDSKDPRESLVHRAIKVPQVC
jgi:hypothetical protein